MTRLSALLVPIFLTLTAAQSLGPTPEVHPKLLTYKCTKKSGCKKQTSFIVLDSLTHPVYQKFAPTLSYGEWGCAPNTTVCPDAKTCAKNCIMDGISDYSKYGVETKGDSLYMDMLSDSGAVLTPRVYLMDTDEHKYDMIKLTGQEFAFTVDVSKLPCGMNGALYLSEMNKYGGPSYLNKGGAEYGTGYCDAQCYTFPFVNGVVTKYGNIEGKGSCCNELDIWEANARATGIAPHPCNITSLYECTGEECAFEGVCDKWGCGQNPYAVGNRDYYGIAKTVDTTRPFTVVTQFPAEKGILKSIHRLYIQDGKVIQNAVVNAPGLPAINYMTDEYCNATGGARRFVELGALEQMGEAMSRGMVLAFAIWWDVGGFMQWMDGGNSGPCNTTEGNPEVIRVIQPDTAVTFSAIKWGEIGSTYSVR